MNYDEDTKQHTISVKFRFPLFNDNHMWINNKDGSYRRDKTGRRKYKVIEGRNEQNTLLTLHSVGHRHVKY